MKQFFHVNEYSPRLYSGFTPMLLAGPVVFHAPSAQRLSRGQAFRAPFGPAEVLNLVEEGHIQVSGRPEWFDKAWRQRKAEVFPDAAWVEEFDAPLAEHARKATDNPEADPVILLEREHGFAWADEQLETAGSAAVASALQLLRIGVVPTGTRERIARIASKRERVRHVLRDARNHEDARLVTRSEISVEGEMSAGMLSSIYRRPGRPTLETPPSTKRLAELLEIIAQLRPIGTVAELKAALADVTPYWCDLDHIMLGSPPVRQAIANCIEISLPKSGTKMGGALAAPMAVAGVAVGINDLFEFKKFSRRSAMLIGGAACTWGAASAAFDDLGIGEAIAGNDVIDSSDRLGGRYWFSLVFRMPQVRVRDAKRLRARVLQG